MKLWLLRPIQYGNSGDPSQDMVEFGPWDPWYDKCFGFVVRAETETMARVIADVNAKEENRDYLFRKGGKGVVEQHPWLDSEYSTCTELTAEGEMGLIIWDVIRA